MEYVVSLQVISHSSLRTQQAPTHPLARTEEIIREA